MSDKGNFERLHFSDGFELFSFEPDQTRDFILADLILELAF